MSAADRVRPRSRAHALTAQASWALATA